MQTISTLWLDKMPEISRLCLGSEIMTSSVLWLVEANLYPLVMEHTYGNHHFEFEETEEGLIQIIQ